MRDRAYLYILMEYLNINTPIIFQIFKITDISPMLTDCKYLLENEHQAGRHSLGNFS